MNRYAFAVFLPLGHVSIVTALTAALVVLTSASPKPDATRHVGTGPVAAAPSGSPRPAPNALPGSLEAIAQQWDHALMKLKLAVEQ